MNIGMLLNAPYPSDLRVKKEATALNDAGFLVHLLCIRKKNEKIEEVIDGIRITRIDAGKNNVQLAFWDVMMSATSIHPKFKKTLDRWIVKNHIRVLHVHDLPLVGTALSVRAKHNLLVVADFHENYPEALKAWFEWKRNPLARLKNKLFMNPARWTIHERKATQNSDRIIAVVEEMKDRLMHDYHVASEKITVVTNSEETDFIHQDEDPSVYKGFEGRFVVTYTGNIGPHRGVDTVIEAMRFLKDLPITFVVVGSGGNVVMKNLYNLSVSLGVNDNVHFLGRQPFSRFYSYMKFASANIIPHKSNGHTDNTVPHKLYQAMMVGRPVIVSSSAPLKRVINHTQAGVIFEAGNSKSCSETIIKLFNSKIFCDQLGQNGLKATLQGSLNWEHTKESLVYLYQSLLQK
jgi:glycosyltransferase involved in cell wall biosynthesis